MYVSDSDSGRENREEGGEPKEKGRKRKRSGDRKKRGKINVTFFPVFFCLSELSGFISFLCQGITANIKKSLLIFCRFLFPFQMIMCFTYIEKVSKILMQSNLAFFKFAKAFHVCDNNLVVVTSYVCMPY